MMGNFAVNMWQHKNNYLLTTYRVLPLSTLRSGSWPSVFPSWRPATPAAFPLRAQGVASSSLSEHRNSSRKFGYSLA
ncbi:hypothetical protein E2C01_069428 [Portunus trituberculatus]|uniref:Uncharacterized protein n=1 Tax=Portunus trituberculatus TaxID=210409 RepID=A0A5B7I2S2_PORTR|nr:hypothetical protein [Portunus trituberculatus]